MVGLNLKTFSKSKYRSKRHTVDSFNFDSKKEAKYYGQLKILQKAGEVLYFLRQVPFHLPGNIVYRCDFMEVWKNGDIKFIDVKGYDTPASKLKRKQVESLYPVKIYIK